MSATAAAPAAQPMRLWEIKDELQEIGALIVEGGGELTDELAARLDAMEGTFEEKVVNTALYVRQCELNAADAKAEKDRLAAIQKAYERQVAWYKDYLVYCMNGAGIKKVETPRARVRVQQSGTPSIDYQGEIDALPESFVRVVPESRSVDKKAMTQALRDGEELPEGVVVRYSESAVIY